MREMTKRSRGILRDFRELNRERRLLYKEGQSMRFVEGHKYFQYDEVYRERNRLRFQV